MIDPLPAVDHDAIDYINFEKNFYEEHSDVAKMSRRDVQELKNSLGIRVSSMTVHKYIFHM